MHHPLDPRICNIILDANALDQDGSARDAMVDRFLELVQAGLLTAVVPKGVRVEVENPRTPVAVKDAMLPRIFTLPVERSASEQEQYRRLHALVQGNAKPGAHDNDIDHLFEAGKYGGGYFITHETRHLKKREEIREIIGPQLHVVTLAEFFAIYDQYQKGPARAEDTNAMTEGTNAVDMHDRAVRKTKAVTAVEECLAILAAEPREPDHWERECLAQAISALFRGAYDLALSGVALAMTPPDERSPKAKLSSDPFYDRCNIAFLREALGEAEAEPLRPLPHFGPIVFSSKPGAALPRAT